MYIINWCQGSRSGWRHFARRSCQVQSLCFVASYLFLARVLRTSEQQTDPILHRLHSQLMSAFQPGETIYQFVNVERRLASFCHVDPFGSIWKVLQWTNFAGVSTDRITGRSVQNLELEMLCNALRKHCLNMSEWTQWTVLLICYLTPKILHAIFCMTVRMPNVSYWCSM